MSDCDRCCYKEVVLEVWGWKRVIFVERFRIEREREEFDLGFKGKLEFEYGKV